MSRISRRDFLNGSLISLGACALPPLWQQLGGGSLAAQTNVYPPLANGLRGNHPGSFEVAHQLVLGGQKNRGVVHRRDQTLYDLVVVGSGISGLAAAYFYRQRFGKDKRILILENHDDFGGHARRNEFRIGRQTRLSYGGSQAMEDPYDYSPEVTRLLGELGVNLRRFETSYDFGFFKRHGLREVTYFNKQRYGRDKVVSYGLQETIDSLPGLLPGRLNYRQAVAQMPISTRARAQMLKVIAGGIKAAQKLSGSQRVHTPFFQFLKQNFQADDPELLHMLRRLAASEHMLGGDILSVSEALEGGLPPLIQPDDDIDLEYDDHYLHHFPDGNASIARLLVQRLIPAVASVHGVDGIVPARFDYSRLDTASVVVRLRLNSTVVRVLRTTGSGSGQQVDVTYSNQGQLFQVRARHAVLACYHSIIPWLLPELPASQKQDLAFQKKMPLVYSTVMLKNWHALKAMGIGAAFSPGNWHETMYANFPVNIGGYQSVNSPNQPMALTLMYAVLPDATGLPPKQHIRLARYKMLRTSYDEFEAEIKSHLTGMLGPGGFQAERDIQAITVNRWAHGYSYAGSDLFDEEDAEGVADRARRSFGPIHIANADAGADADMGTAIEQAWRAVREM
ncbi:MAG: NAD(P)/FAD-dependent oxidoreductase [Leptospiraceae bacterium]|nr:NAD(P)/FAD-dependent oxidoreductase [Leptospiraceae bacterium]